MTSLTLVRRIKARPSIVFEAMTTAPGMSRWWGPDPLPVLEVESDARLGGRFRVRFRTMDGAEHECSGAFLKFVPHTHIAMSWRWTGGLEDPGESRIDVALRPIPEGTEVTFTHGLLHDEESARSHEGGWTRAFEKLEAWLATQA